MIEQQLFFGALTEQEYRYWSLQGKFKRLAPGETIVEADDFPDLYVVIEGRFVMKNQQRSPGIIGLDEFLTGWMTDREWIADQGMTLFSLDAGRFGQILALEPKRRLQFHQGVLSLLAGRLYRNLSQNDHFPICLTRGHEVGVRRFNELQKRMIL